MSYLVHLLGDMRVPGLTKLTQVDSSRLGRLGVRLGQLKAQTQCEEIRWMVTCQLVQSGEERLRCVLIAELSLPLAERDPSLGRWACRMIQEQSSTHVIYININYGQLAEGTGNMSTYQTVPPTGGGLSTLPHAVLPGCRTEEGNRERRCSPLGWCLW